MIITIIMIQIHIDIMHNTACQRADPPCQVHHHRIILTKRCPLFELNITYTNRFRTPHCQNKLQHALPVRDTVGHAMTRSPMPSRAKPCHAVPWHEMSRGHGNHVGRSQVGRFTRTDCTGMLVHVRGSHHWDIATKKYMYFLSGATHAHAPTYPCSPYA